MKKLFIAITSVLIVWTSGAAQQTTQAEGNQTGKRAAPVAWQRPLPPYPSAAEQKRLEGQSWVRVTTDRSGKVTQAVIVEPGVSILDRHTVQFVRNHWTGPPNTSRIFVVFYQNDKPPHLSKLEPGMWRTPRPSYPLKALAARAHGAGLLRITTNRFGRVDKVEILDKIHPLLDAYTVAFARAHWKGPANSTRTVPILYIPDQ